ncbi:uncharacterized protein LOC144600259 isoform X1 [Rhinoraja longicauda]
MEFSSMLPDSSATCSPKSRHRCTPTLDHEEGDGGRRTEVWCSDRSLDLCRNNLTCLKCDMPRFIEHLYLEGNLLQELPGELFDHLPQLVWLDLRKNKLEKLPASIGKHRCLRALLLETNPLRELPIELGNVQSLKALNLRNCPLQFPPSEVVNLGTQIILSFLREQACKPLLQTLNLEAGPDHYIKKATQLHRVMKMQNSLEIHSKIQNKDELQRSTKSLLSVESQRLHDKFVHKPVIYSTIIDRNHFLESGDCRQNFEIKANTKGHTGNVHQKRTVKGKMLPSLKELLEKQDYSGQIQRKKKQLKTQDATHEKKKDTRLAPLETDQKIEDEINAIMHSQDKAEEGREKEPSISKVKDLQMKLQHRLQWHQEQRRKKHANTPVSQEDDNSTDQNTRKSLTELKREITKPVEYRFCAFIGEYK